MAVNATETHFLECLAYHQNDSGEISHYNLNAMPKKRGAHKTIRVTPNQLASASSLKKILLAHGILYLASSSEHNELLKLLFKNPPTAV